MQYDWRNAHAKRINGYAGVVRHWAHAANSASMGTGCVPAIITQALSADENIECVTAKLVSQSAGQRRSHAAALLPLTRDFWETTPA